jgi:hypothetical protein
MDVRFVSSLTDEDENRVAQSLISAVDALLGHFPLAYAIRIETTGGRVYQHTHIAPSEPGHDVADAEPSPSVDLSGFLPKSSAQH